jgi:hypothetical protein
MLGLSIAAVAAVAAPAGALAADAGVTGTVTGGALTLTTSATPSFSATLDGTDQAKTFSIPSVLSDLTGSGAGWHTTVTSTQYTTGGATPRTLATDASTLTSLVNTCGSGTCTDETNSVSLPVGVPAGSTAPTAVAYHNAAVDTGAGVFDHTPTISVALPANTYAGSYSSTVTLAAISGP